MNTFRKHPLRIYTILLLIITVIVSSTTIFLVTQTKYNKFNKPTNNKSAIITHTPIPHTSYTPIRQARTALNSQQGCGVTKNSNGGYNFSWLHVDNATGYIMDAQNCIVDLRGFEW